MNVVTMWFRQFLSAYATVIASPLAGSCGGGGGPPAVTDNRAASIRLEAVALDTTEQVPLDYSVLDASGHVLSNYPARFSIAAPAVAQVSSTGTISGVSYGATAVTITADAVSHTESVFVEPWPHQPDGFHLLTERDFSRLATSPSDTVGMQGWDAHEESQFPNLSIANDPLAPRSPPGVLQASYAAGTTGGSSAATPGRLQRWLDTPAQSVYLSVWVQLSANWQAHSTGTNKVLFVWINGQPRFFVSAEGSRSDALQPSGRLQGTPDDLQRGREVLPPNLSNGGHVVPGAWQRWEMVVKANTPGMRDGEFHLWMDGVEVGRYTDVQYLAAGESQPFMMIDIEPIWGGGGDRLAAAQWMRFDHIYVSTK